MQRTTIRTGTSGLTVSALRPSGTVRIDGQDYPAMSEGHYIDHGREVTVLQVRSFGLLVREPGEPRSEDPAGVQNDRQNDLPSQDPAPAAAGPRMVAPRLMIERLNTVLLGTIGWSLAGAALTVPRFGADTRLLALPLAGAIAGLIFRYFVRGMYDLAAPYQDHRRASVLLACTISMGGVVGVGAAFLAGGAAIGLSAGLVLGTAFAAVMTLLGLLAF